MEQQPQKKWKSGITLGELITALAMVIVGMLTFWKTTDVRLSALELRMNSKEKADDQINFKLDKLQDGINDVKITLQNKQDRKP